ncbi:MAG: flagellar hook-basal body protein [Lachnospiraceae bacterium]|nr:flagellar hook-basal body protein [Lachnospiraceae bacterium]
MVRSLWTAASGMIAQQNNVDTIANNLANVNTTGYKTEVAEFKSLLYQDIQAKTTSGNGETKPVGAQVGLGVRNSSVTSRFTQGSFYESSSNLAFAIGGDGFFGIRGQDGNTYYSRNGDFHLSTYGTGLALTTSDGNLVLDSTGKPIELGGSYVSSKIVVNGKGELCYPDENNNVQPLGITIGVWQFNNPSGLEKMGDSLFAATGASGQAMNEATTNGLIKSELRQGYLEGSNVQVADEMVNMIVAQRAYELNSKAIQATDEMMSQANQLRR